MTVSMPCPITSRLLPRPLLLLQVQVTRKRGRARPQGAGPRFRGIWRVFLGARGLCGSNRCARACSFYRVRGCVLQPALLDGATAMRSCVRPTRTFIGRKSEEAQAAELCNEIKKWPKNVYEASGSFAPPVVERACGCTCCAQSCPPRSPSRPASMARSIQCSLQCSPGLAARG